MAQLLKWQTQPAPTGRYKAFDKRGWPHADFNGTEFTAAAIYCDDDYRPSNAKLGHHAPLTVRVADYRADGKSWEWRTMKNRPATLDEAKKQAAQFFEKNTHWLPLSLRPE